MLRFWQFYCLFFLNLLLTQPGLAQSTPQESSPTKSTPLQSQESTERGEVILQGEKGQYQGQMVIQGNLEKAWEVLTDYNNFANFLPNIASSRLVEATDQVKVFEQINIVDLLILEKQFTIKIEATESYPKLIDFKLVDGDLGDLRGTWEIKKISDDKILVTHQVTVAPQSETGSAFFFGVYESSLEETLAAIAKEISDRSSPTGANEKNSTLTRRPL